MRVQQYGSRVAKPVVWYKLSKLVDPRDVAPSWQDWL